MLGASLQGMKGLGGLAKSTVEAMVPESSWGGKHPWDISSGIRSERPRIRRSGRRQGDAPSNSSWSQRQNFHRQDAIDSLSRMH